MLNYNLKENVAHGDRDFPISLYDNNSAEPDAQILPCHWHSEFEFIYVYRGTGKFIIENDSYTLKEGQALIVNPEELHSGYSLDAGGCSYYAFVFNINYLTGAINDICEKKYISHLAARTKRITNLQVSSSEWQAEIIDILSKIIKSIKDKKSGFELYIKGQLFIMLNIFFSNNAITDVSRNPSRSISGNTDAIKRVLKFIDENYMNDIKVDTLAEIANISKFHFIHVFNTITGMSPIKYLNMIRINEAAVLLRTSGSKITETAGKCGFNNIGYFIRMFKSYKNITPYNYMLLHSRQKE